MDKKMTKEDMIDTIKVVMSYLYKDIGDTWHGDLLSDVLEGLNNGNVEPVVRCKDCRYMTEHYDTDGNVPYWTCSEWDGGTDYDGYCHFGERREDAQTN